jgi:hypothetical protein
VRRGIYALQAIHNGTRDSQGIRVGAVEVDVGDRAIDAIPITAVPGAQIEGRIVFNGNVEPSLAKTVIRLIPDGRDADARALLTPWSEWRADGSFSILGVLGRNRLSIELSDSWFVDRALLEDGTDIANSAFNFEPGRIYKNVRVFANDATAEIVAKLPPDEQMTPMTVVVFPADASLWEDSRYVKVVTATTSQNELSIKTLPPGRGYFVALHSHSEGSLSVNTSVEVLGELVEKATSIFVEGPGKYTVTLYPSKR